MRLHKLLPNLWVSNWPDKETVRAQNFEIIFTVCKKFDPILDAQHQFYIPLSDGKKLPPEVWTVVDKITARYFEDKKILVHCYLGKNRSYLAAILAYSAIKNVPASQVLEMVRKEYPGAITNKVFEAYLLRR